MGLQGEFLEKEHHIQPFHQFNPWILWRFDAKRMGEYEFQSQLSHLTLEFWKSH